MKKIKKIAILIVGDSITAWKMSKYGVFFWSVFSHIRTEYRGLLRKKRTRKNSVFAHFSRSVWSTESKEVNCLRLYIVNRSLPKCNVFISDLINLNYDCHIFSKYLVFQMKNLVFQSKYLVFWSKTLDFDRNTRFFESEILKY